MRGGRQKRRNSGSTPTSTAKKQTQQACGTATPVDLLSLVEVQMSAVVESRERPTEHVRQVEFALGLNPPAFRRMRISSSEVWRLPSIFCVLPIRSRTIIQGGPNFRVSTTDTESASLRRVRAIYRLSANDFEAWSPVSIRQARRASLNSCRTDSYSGSFQRLFSSRGSDRKSKSIPSRPPSTSSDP